MADPEWSDETIEVSKGNGNAHDTAFMIAGMVSAMCEDIVVKMMSPLIYMPPVPEQGVLTASVQLRCGEWVDIAVTAREGNI